MRCLESHESESRRLHGKWKAEERGQEAGSKALPHEEQEVFLGKRAGRPPQNLMFGKHAPRELLVKVLED